MQEYMGIAGYIFTVDISHTINIARKSARTQYSACDSPSPCSNAVLTSRPALSNSYRFSA